MSANQAAYRLGIDLGTNSLGWAAVELDSDGKPCGIVDMGVRIFSDGRGGRGKASNAANRRIARGQRRRRDRYLRRRSQLMDALVEFGLMPENESKRKALESIDPYELRAQALDKPLKPFELGRALFHLDQRRGFKSNRKVDGKDENEAKKTLEEISELRKSMEESGARTLGEHLAWRHGRGETVRARPGHGLYPDRAIYEQEFDAIRMEQQRCQSLSDEQWDRLRDVIFFQRPLKPVDPGWCQFEFENGERRAARALPVFQEFRMLQEVNNLRALVGTDPERPLDEGERERALKRLRSGQDIELRTEDGKLAKPTLDLGLPPGTTLNLSAGGRNAIKGDETTAKLKKPAMFGKRWLTLKLVERNEIVKFLLESEEPEAVRRKAKNEWGLSDERAKAVSNVSLVSGYGSLSEKAIAKILPHMEKGRGYSDAVIDAGYSHHSDFRSEEALERLPYYGKVLERDMVGADPSKDPKDGEAERYGRFPNPTVHIGLNQLRRVVNRLIDVYGKPEEIVVELARDLKSNERERLRYAAQRKEGEKRNKRFREMLESAADDTPNTRFKLRLWEEQGPQQARVCPYTGRQLSFEMVVSNQTEIDHILPFSRTLDDSIANKVVCMADANRKKGDKSPHKAFGHSPDGYDYDAILTRAADLPPNKRWRFQPDAMERFKDEREFLDRQLNETRYLSRTARTYLARLYAEKAEKSERVRAVPGRMTALLRRGWDLHNMLSVDETDGKRKQRNDHRHHAIDAFVVANTTQGLLQQFACAAASRRYVEKNLAAVAKEALPWEDFHRNQLKPFLDRLVVSHKPDHGSRGVRGKTTGQLHEETAYGLVEFSKDGTSRVVRRKNIADVVGPAKKLAEVPKKLNPIRDDALRKALLELWNEVQAEGGGKPDFVEKAATEGVLLNGRRQIVRRVRMIEHQTVIPISDRDGKPYKAYMSGSNEFADVWRMRDGSWKIVVIPTFHANQPDFDIEKFRPRTARGKKHKGKPDPTAKRLMRLHKGDMGALGEGRERRIVWVRQIIVRQMRGSIVLSNHHEASDQQESEYSASTLLSLGFRKISVDEIGRVTDPGPRAE